MTITAFYKPGETRLKILRDARLITKFIIAYGPLIAVTIEPTLEDANKIVSEFRDNEGRELMHINVQPYSQELAKQGIFKIMTSGLVVDKKRLRLT